MTLPNQEIDLIYYKSSNAHMDSLKTENVVYSMIYLMSWTLITCRVIIASPGLSFSLPDFFNVSLEGHPTAPICAKSLVDVPITLYMACILHVILGANQIVGSAIVSGWRNSSYQILLSWGMNPGLGLASAIAAVPPADTVAPYNLVST